METHAAFFLALRESDVERLGTDHLTVHFRDGAGRLIRRGKGDEGGASGRARGIAHHAARGDGTELVEQFTKFFIIGTILEVLDVEVGPSHLLHALTALGVELRLQLSLALSLLLRAADDPRLLIFGVAIELFHRSGGTFR